MSRYTVSTAGPTLAGSPCRLSSEHGLTRCGRPVHYVVDVFDLDETPARHVRTLGVCDEHADNYR